MYSRKTHNRLYEIDLFRFIAACMIVLFHYAFRGMAADGMSIMNYPPLEGAAKYGYLGVHLFFIISGFVILMTASQGSARQFIISRTVRLYPAFWVCCTMSALVMALAGNQQNYQVTAGQYLLNMTMAAKFLGIPSIDDVYWSLYVEIQFYLLVCIVLALGMIRHAERLLGIWLAAVLVVSRWEVPYLSLLAMPEYAHYFIAGSMFYISYTSGFTAYRICILGVCYVLALWGGVSQASALVSHYRVPFDVFIVSAVITSFFVIFSLVSLRYTRLISTPRWLVLGAITYPLYLIHQNVGYTIFNHLFPKVGRHMVMWGTVIGMMFFAYAVNTLIEKRFADGLKLLLGRLLGVEAARPVLSAGSDQAMPHPGEEPLS
ncbi:MAG TPA: acyltransferase [Deltaproteobacteria bacterium]|jgi:peptidoglycan/LPS O-acetylase OafA/YrhL|nr:acyltransferase [Deltaproteobacteria bacterium]